MKKNKIRFVALFLLGVMGFTSCSNDDFKRDKVDLITATISPYTNIKRDGMTETVTEGMSVKVGSNDDYSFLAFNSIDGFLYEGGYEYSVELQRTTLANPPADASCYRYKLNKINSKVDKAQSRTDINLYVSGEMGEYKEGTFTQDMSSPGIKYRESEADDWSVGPINRIQGFNYEAGYNYVLTVQKIILTKDDSNYYQFLQPIQYKLIKVVSKLQN